MKKFNILVTVPQANVASLIGLLTGVPGVKITVSETGGDASKIVAPAPSPAPSRPLAEDGPTAIARAFFSGTSHKSSSPEELRQYLVQHDVLPSNASPTITRLLRAGFIERTGPGQYRKA